MSEVRSEVNALTRTECTESWNINGTGGTDRRHKGRSDGLETWRLTSRIMTGSVSVNNNKKNRIFGRMDVEHGGQVAKEEEREREAEFLAATTPLPAPIRPAHRRG